jgi:hypothetical protein
MTRRRTRALALQTAIVCALIVSGAFFGIELATTGLQRVQGTYERTVAQPEAIKVQTPPPEAKKREQPDSPTASALPQALPPEQQQEVFINRFAIKLGEALQALAKSTIHAVVKLFQEIIY